MKGTLGAGLISLVSIGFAASVALADENPPIISNVFTPWCSLSYRSDSYGRGLEAVFTGVERRPRIVDEQCFQLGIDQGRVIRAQNRDSSCLRDFGAGRLSGFAAGYESAGSECFNAGYSAGRAALDIGAREGDVALVGLVCVSEYRRGRADAIAHLVAQPGTPEPTATCYLLGHFEGEMFP